MRHDYRAPVLSLHDLDRHVPALIDALFRQHIGLWPRQQRLAVLQQQKLVTEPACKGQVVQRYDGGGLPRVGIGSEVSQDHELVVQVQRRCRLVQDQEAGGARRRRCELLPNSWTAFRVV